jgi:cell division protein FtsN
MMKTSYRSRVIGSIVVLAVLMGIAMLVLHRKQPAPKGLALNDQTHQVLSLPVVSEQSQTAWHARQSQQIDQTRVAAAQQPIEKPAPSPMPTPVTAKQPVHSVIAKAKPAHPVILQVASFSSIKNARVMRDHLSAAGYLPRLQPVRVHNKTWYRLSAGPFTNAKQAQLAQQAIQKKWKVKARVKSLH